MAIDTSGFPRATSLVEAVLEGGPADMPATERRRRVIAGESRIKVQHYGGYEHFELDSENTGSADERAQHIYRWVARTCIAE
jgi:hypothetical protein